MIEERESGLAVVSYVWSPVYVDEMISRDRDTDANGSLDERLYVLHDANFNVTGLVNTSGTVVERFTYEPFGKVEIRDASWAIKSGGTGYDWLYLHQGGRFDSVSGLYAFRMREYSPTLGRWMTCDQLELLPDENFYRAYSNAPVSHTDSSGVFAIKVWSAAFIPGRLGTWLYEPMDIYGFSFKTDGRGFGGNLGNSRIYSQFSFDSGQIGSLNGVIGLIQSNTPGGGTWSGPLSGETRTGVSSRVLRASLLAQGYQFIDVIGLYSDPIFKGAVLKKYAIPTTHGNVKSRTFGSIKATTVHYTISASYPFLPGPSIDMIFDLTFTKDCQTDTVAMQGDYFHDSFPDYEFYVSGKRGVITLDNFTTQDDGPGIVNLNSTVSKAVAAVLS